MSDMNEINGMSLDRRRFLWTSSAVALASAGGGPGLAWAGAGVAAGPERSYPLSLIHI